LGKLKKNALMSIAMLTSDDERAAALRARLDRSDGPSTTKRAPAAPQEPMSPHDRRLSITRKGFSLKVRQPAELLPPEEARDVIANELAPAMLAFTERAHGGGGREGFYLDMQPAHMLLVIPSEVEALSLPHLTQLAEHLEAVRKRVKRSQRSRSPHAATARSGKGQLSSTETSPAATTEG
jgi:hypothetical protein